MENADNILQLLKQGDKRGLELLFRHFYKPLVFYALKFLENKEEAEDVVQDVFVKFWEEKRFYAIENYLRSYLYQSVRNRCLNLIEARKGITVCITDETKQIAEVEYLDETEWNVRIDRIYQAIDRLPERTREVFLKIVLEEKQYKEVAEEFQISVNTVKTLLARGLATLRKELDEKTYLFLLFLI